MTLALWIVSVAALVGVVVVGFVLAGTLREVEEIRRRLDTGAGVAGPPRVRAGLPPGARVPSFETTALDGASFRFAANGTRRLVVFAHPGCAPCEGLVPSLVRAAESGEVPPTVVVARGRRDEIPSTWRSKKGKRFRVVLENGDDVSASFDTAITPHVFVVGDDLVEAQGPAGSVDQVHRLLRAADRWSSEGVSLVDPASVSG